MFNSMAGLNGASSSSMFSSAVGGLRNLMTSAMLGTSVLTATSDQAIMRANARRLDLTETACDCRPTRSGIFSAVMLSGQTQKLACWWIHTRPSFPKWGL
jgi:hypothetical protein